MLFWLKNKVRLIILTHVLLVTDDTLTSIWCSLSHSVFYLRIQLRSQCCCRRDGSPAQNHHLVLPAKTTNYQEPDKSHTFKKKRGSRLEEALIHCGQAVRFQTVIANLLNCVNYSCSEAELGLQTLHLTSKALVQKQTACAHLAKKACLLPLHSIL